MVDDSRDVEITDQFGCAGRAQLYAAYIVLFVIYIDLIGYVARLQE